ncbi:hypothetical protein [Haliscomenobacter sp.]|uniref:hypothetical protein n=1 Tax=Haliscomenobacter sp. TaxID=2717303 RepID=UPI00359462CE
MKKINEKDMILLHGGMTCGYLDWMVNQMMDGYIGSRMQAFAIRDLQKRGYKLCD